MEPDAPRVHRKRADRSPGGAERVRREADVLSAAQHPGVVELVGLEGGNDRPVLVTSLVEGPTLAAPPALATEELAGLFGALATTLADLHDMGIVHSSVAAEHVVIRPDGQPVLCGFGSAGQVGGASPTGEDLDPSDDVAALGRALRRLATGPGARTLRELAETATSSDVSARPTARDLAAAMAAVPGARLPSRRQPAAGSATDLRALLDAGTRRGRPSRARPDASMHADPPKDGSAPSAPGGSTGIRPIPGGRGSGSNGSRDTRRIGALAGGGLAVASAILLFLASRSPQAPAPPPSGGAAATVTPASTAPASTAPAATGPAATGPAATGPASTTAASTAPAQNGQDHGSACARPAAILTADVDGDDCLDALRYSGGVLESDDTRWALGRDGDQVTTGDWYCTGQRTVVLLRPSTGQIFRFEGWAVTPDGSTTAPLVATVADGKAVRAADVDRDGCHEVVVERGELPPRIVRLPRSHP